VKYKRLLFNVQLAPTRAPYTVASGKFEAHLPGEGVDSGEGLQRRGWGGKGGSAQWANPTRGPS